MQPDGDLCENDIQRHLVTTLIGLVASIIAFILSCINIGSNSVVDVLMFVFVGTAQFSFVVLLFLVMRRKHKSEAKSNGIPVSDDSKLT